MLNPDFSPLILLELRLRTLRPINRLPHFHGPHWGALLRHVLRSRLDGRTLAEAGVALQTVECGISGYPAGAPLRLGLSFPATLAERIAAALRDFNRVHSPGGHFQPGLTIELEEVRCRLSGETAASFWRPLCEADLGPEIEHLRNLERFTLTFGAPLRLTRPAGTKRTGHRYADEDYFFAGDSGDARPLDVFFHRLRLPDAAAISADGLERVAGAVTWLDVPYGGPNGKTLGGLVGQLGIRGRPSREQARLLVWGQYAGCGKNAPFGFGFYVIPELSTVRRVAPLARGRSLLDQALEPAALNTALGRLPNASPGPDGLTVADLRQAGEPFLRRLADEVRSDRYVPGPVKRYRLPKPAGAHREIVVQNVAERLLHRALADCLGPAIDRLLSASSYAYRRGLSRKSAASRLRELLAAGYDRGVKADIASFFDSVRLDILMPLLQGLFPAEPAIELIARWLEQSAEQGIAGLPQGGILSPLLSNLYLDRFDRALEGHGLRLIRYADDFVVLFPRTLSTEKGLETVRAALSRLGLALREEKTETIHKGRTLRFLGYLVSAEGFAEPEKEPEPDDDEWAPVFHDDWQGGVPVYLTILSKGARSDAAHLVIEGDDETQERIPWNRISRLVVVGRSRFSGGVIYRAVREAVPVTFIDIIGRTRGTLHAARWPQPDLASLQAHMREDDSFRLAFARAIVAAKIHNSRVLLRRNSIRCHELHELAGRAASASDLDQLRGYEGAAARAYFAAFAGLVAPFSFRGRFYRPPDCPVNAMLSFGYTLLYHRLAATLRDRGFNPRLGFYHQGRGSHCALASDLQEELRHLVERMVLAVIHLREITPDDFTVSEIDGRRAWRLSGNAFRIFIRRFETTMAGRFNVPGKGQLSYNAYLDEMADRLRRALKLGIPYQPLRIR